MRRKNQQTKFIYNTTHRSGFRTSRSPRPFSLANPHEVAQKPPTHTGPSTTLQPETPDPPLDRPRSRPIPLDANKALQQNKHMLHFLALLAIAQAEPQHAMWVWDGKIALDTS